ncbi:hypothetical protein P3T76_012030 [Phytophthora citrophthora]|uniref:Uncharacterized protein n=1 Tax=Phytophthora citrophthora TaxID=4793 RepID=A0AAD9G5X7_9STRA|nr:hypothetical protein P3T76_012030 [Phytophthora citrophthora]
MCDLLLETDDVNLATKFFTDYCVRLGYLEGSKMLLPSLTKAIQKFGWSVIGEAVLAVLKNTETMVLSEESPENLENPKLLKVGGFENDSSAELLLQVTDGLSEGEVKRGFVKAAVENGLDVRSSAVAQTLWKYTTTHTEIIDEVVTKLQEKDPHELVPFTNCCSQYIADLNEEDDTFVKLHAIAAKRCEWLREEIQRLEKPFTWEMPYAKETTDEMLNFLRGPDETMDFHDDFCLCDANWFAKQCLSPRHASVMVEVVPDEKEPFVRFTKTRKWFEVEMAKIPEYKSELELLDKLDKPSSGRKKPRLSK